MGDAVRTFLIRITSSTPIGVRWVIMTASRCRILFVDDEPEILGGLQRLLRRYRDSWEMVFVDSAEEALRSMAVEPFDVVVSDMRMPGMDGAKLLGSVRSMYPATVRIILSGFADPASMTRVAPLAHQILAKPVDSEMLIAAISRAASVKDRISDDGIRAAVGDLSALPSPSATTTRLHRLLAEPVVDTQQVAELIRSDIAASTKLLQMSNSAFYGLPRVLTDAGEAVRYLGLPAVRDVLVSCEVMRALGSTDPEICQLIERIQTRATRRADLALALAAGRSAVGAGPSETWGAAFLAEVGTLAAVVAGCADARTVIDQWEVPVGGIPATPTGTAYAAIGGYLLATWGLPFELVEAVALSAEHPTTNSSVAAGLSWLAATMLGQRGPTDPALVESAKEWLGVDPAVGVGAGSR